MGKKTVDLFLSSPTPSSMGEDSAMPYDEPYDDDMMVTMTCGQGHQTILPYKEIERWTTGQGYPYPPRFASTFGPPKDFTRPCGCPWYE